MFALQSQENQSQSRSIKTLPILSPHLFQGSENANHSLTYSQCDLFTPSCGQCVRGSRNCFGYRNPTELRFHDQSEEVACKVRLATRTPQRRAAEKAPNEASTHFDSIRVSPGPDLLKHFNAPSLAPLSLSMSVESQAFCFFFNNYPSQPSKKFETVYEEIPALYCLGPPDSPLLCIITALGLAGLSYHTETSGMEVAASVWYEKALHKINKSLRDRELVKLDQTLLVVLLLGLYEVCTTPHNQRARGLLHIRRILAARLGR
jgi:hypothetical protein